MVSLEKTRKTKRTVFPKQCHSSAVSLFCGAITRTESHRQRLRAGPVPSPRYSGERVRVRGSSHIKITRGSSRKFRDSFSVKHQDFDETFTFKGRGKKTTHPHLLPELPGPGDAPLRGAMARHRSANGVVSVRKRLEAVVKGGNCGR